MELEAAAPEAVARMLEQSERTVKIAVNDKGQCVSMRSGRVMWDAMEARPNMVTRAVGYGGMTYDSASAFAIIAADVYTWSSQPFCHELPTAILDHLGADVA